MDSTVIIAEDSNKIMNKPEPFKKTGLGERLKSAREAMQLTDKEAAARLHLNITIIALLENENFMDGPPTTFIRGYLRAYARLLNLSDNEITLTLKNLENSIPSSSSTPVPVVPMKTKTYNERYLHWLTYVIGLVLIVLVSVWWSSHSRYVIADVPPAPAAINTKTTPSVTPAEPNSASTIATTATPAQQSAPLLQNVPAPATPATPAIQSPPLPTATQSAPTTTQPIKQSPISNLNMALPEPDIDN